MSLSEVSLKWNGFETNMLNNLKYAFRDENYADVSLVCEGISIKSHKVVLSACSPLFKNIFIQNPHPFTVIVLQDVSLFNLKALLTFIYNGELKVNQEHLSELLKAAENLKIRGLTTVAEDVHESPKRNHAGVYDPSPEKTISHVHLYNEEENKQMSTEPSDVGDIIPKEEPPDIICVEAILNEGFGNQNNVSTNTDQTFFMQPEIQGNEHNTENVRQTKLKGKASKTGKIKKKKIKQKKKHNLIIYSDISDKSNMSDFELGKENMVTDEDIEKDMDNVLQSDVILEAFNAGVVCEDDSKKEQPKPALEYASPKFPCPFCMRTYHTWGYRRRHVKSRHRANRLTCKICEEQTTSQSSWYDHVVQKHAMARAEARDSLVILVEAHAVLTCTAPPSPTYLLNDFQIEQDVKEPLPI